MKSYDVTIHMKPLCLSFQMVLHVFVFKILQKKFGNLCRTLPLATLGTERVNLLKE